MASKVGNIAPLGAFVEGQGRKLVLKTGQGEDFIDEFGKP